MPPVNDFIDDAILITAPSTTSVSTVGAVLGGSGNPIDDDFPYPDVWYRMEPTVDILLGISLSKTSGGAGVFPEADIYTLETGEDPPNDWLDLVQPYDFCGNGTDTPSGWFDGPSQYFKLQEGKVYYINCTDYNYANEIEFDMVLTTAEPLVNDDWEDATVINQPGGNVFQVTNVDATGGQQGTSQSEDNSPSVWYRIEVPDDGYVSLSILNPSGYGIEAEYRHFLDIYGPISDPVNDLDDILTASYVGSISDTGPYSNHPSYDETGGWEPWLREWTASAGDIYYVRVSNNSQPNDPTEGLFTMRVTLRDWTTFNAADGINNGSATTSIVDTDWVKDTQYKTLDPNKEERKGTLDYTKTFEIEPGLSGKYEVNILARFNSGSAKTNSSSVVVMRVNGVPVRVGLPVYWNTNNTQKWVAMTSEYMLLTTGGFGFVISPGRAIEDDGAPRYVELKGGDIVSFEIGNELSWEPSIPTNPPDRWLEVQKVRFCPVSGYDPVPSWKMSKFNQEKWEFNDFSNLMGCTHGDKLYIFDDVLIMDDPTGEELVLNVWEYQLVDGRMESVNGDIPLGDTGWPFTDHALDRGGINNDILMKDIVVIDNGDIYILWVEQSGTGTGGDWWLVLKKWDAGSQTWSLIEDNVTGNGAPSTTHIFNSPNMDTDGEDVWIIWGENRVSDDFGAGGWWWRCKKYDTSADTLTELGSGQTAYPSATAPTRVGDFDYRMRVRASPLGIPYVLFEEIDPDEIPPNESYFFLWRWAGSNWEDMQLPHPSPAPDPVGTTNPSIFTVGSPGDPQGNYGSATQDIFVPQDIVFCHHDGPSETPAIIHSFWWNGVGQISGSGDLGDLGSWWYAECDGIGDWHHEQLIIEGVTYGQNYPNRFPHATNDFDGNTFIPWGGGWTQGCRLQAFNGRPIFSSRLGYFGSGVDCVYVAQINSEGNTWDLLGQRFPTDVYTPDISGYQWSDHGESVLTIQDTLVAFWEDQGAFGFSGYFVAVFAPGGAVDLTRVKFRSFQLGDA